MAKEANDDYHRYERDRVLNNKLYTKIDKESKMRQDVTSEELRVGDVVIVNTGERVPADIVILYTEKLGTVFIKTD